MEGGYAINSHSGGGSLGTSVSITMAMGGGLGGACGRELQLLFSRSDVTQAEHYHGLYSY